MDRRLKCHVFIHSSYLFCTDEDDKVELVLKRFVGVGAGAAIDNTLQKLVGRVVLANAPFFAPANWMVIFQL